MDSAKGCRIAVGWDPLVMNARLIHQSDQCMHFEVKMIKDNKMLIVSIIYGENTPGNRKSLWHNLINHKQLFSGKPWVLMGDFNIVLKSCEHSNGLNVRGDGMHDFRDCVSDLGVEDLNMCGMYYTWIQKMRNPLFGILKKLDKVMANSNFIDVFPTSYANFMPYMSSDHSPAVLTFPDLCISNAKAFRFMNFLADKKEFICIVKDNWDVEVVGHAMFRLAKRLKNMKKYLRDMNRRSGNVFDRVEAIRTELARVQMSLDKDPDNAVLREEELIYAHAFREAVIDEEKVLKQKSKIQWLKEGDFNSTYFHKVVKGRVSRNRIDVVYNDEGKACHGMDATNLFVSHFQTFLGTEDHVYDIDDAGSLFVKKLGAEVSIEMIRPVTNEEIKDAIFSIDDNKASGPDGFSSKFFKAAWNTVGMDVCSAVKEFFTSGKLLGEFNTTMICLVPKIKSPARVTDYRPISCCNVVYKGISKVITNRLKGVLNELVDVNQSAFIPGRLISDNILLAQEFMMGYNRSHRTRNCAFKIDIQKAYDTVNWKFLEACLREFGIHTVMVHWIMVCVTSASFSVCVSGEAHGFFRSKRGLRQGDPMSPYLFTLVMEVLNLMIKRQVRLDKRFKYHTGCNKLKITNLCFADDLLMMCHGDLMSASILRRSLDEFSMTSGLYPSMNKSEAFFVISLMR